jgi:hypothetical protein
MPANGAGRESGGDVTSVRARSALTAAAWPRQHFLYFLPLPHGQDSLRPILFMNSIVARLGVELGIRLSPTGLGGERPQPGGYRRARGSKKPLFLPILAQHSNFWL